MLKGRKNVNVKPVTIKEVIVHQLRMKLNSPFKTSFGTVEEKDFFIIQAVDEDGCHGFGESVAFSEPWYTEETVKTTAHVMEDFLIPLLFKKPFHHPDEAAERFSPVRRNNMAKAAIEGAVWDLFAKKANMPLASFLGGIKTEIEVGIAIGMQPEMKGLLKKIEEALLEGYKRIKIKIKPGQDVEVLREIRKHFPDIPLMADANSSYTLKDIDHLRKLDELNLLMIEQPLGADDLIDHAKLQREIETPICLDESIYSLQDVKIAAALGSGKIINIKAGRVGGLSEAKKIHDYCKEHGLAVWCGGMLEAGVGRAQNIALSSLDHFLIPGDTSPSKRYWQEDIISPEVEMENGVIKIPAKPGIGFEINWDVLEAHRICKKVYKNL